MELGVLRDLLADDRDRKPDLRVFSRPAEVAGQQIKASDPFLLQSNHILFVKVLIADVVLLLDQDGYADEV